MLRPSNGNSYGDSPIEKIRDTKETIIIERLIAKHPERFAADSRAAAVLARENTRAELKAKGTSVRLNFSPWARAFR